MNSRRVETLEGQLSQRLGKKLIGCASGYARHGNDTKRQEARRLRKALRLARRADCVIFCGGLDEMAETEGLDRKTLALPTAQQRALRALAAVNPDIVLVLSAGSVVDLAPAATARAMLHGYLGGEAGAGAMAELLYGDANPSGKLAESYPLTLEDTPAYPYRKLRGNCAEYRESIYVGYRYYDKAKVPLRYPFGFGLSYTRFAYEDLRLSEAGVRFRLRNTGSRAGAEIAELYIGAAESETFRPEKELKGFAKVFLKAGEEKEVFIPFDDKSFRVFDSVENRFLEESGRYWILIGASAADIRLNGELVRAGEKLGRLDEKKRLPHYFSGAAQPRAPRAAPLPAASASAEQERGAKRAGPESDLHLSHALPCLFEVRQRKNIARYDRGTAHDAERASLRRFPEICHREHKKPPGEPAE